MKCLFLNLPYPVQVIRRYMCSYNTQFFLFPPLELMYLAAVAKQWKNAEVSLIDAVAEKQDIGQVIKSINLFNPDIAVTLIGFETFEKDIENINLLKENRPNLKVIVFGYYPTLFADTILARTKIDMIIRGEPELAFSQVYDYLDGKGRPLSDVDGLAYRQDNGKICLTNSQKRIQDLDQLPYPDYSMFDINNYNEPFMKKPFALIQSARGCPFNCRYCVRTYGKQLVLRSTENVLDELENLVKKDKIRSFRFLDDTFTIDKKRVLKICQGIIQRGLRFEWSCLSRIDTLDDEMISSMQQAGCIRLLLGIESGSQQLLDSYGKGYNLEEVKTVVKKIKKRNIESVGWFIVGGQLESREDYKKSTQLAKRLDLDFIAVSGLCLYPGTPLFEETKENIEFSLFPYRNRYKNDNIEYKALQRERAFYRTFYLSPFYLPRFIKFFLKYPRQVLFSICSMLRYIINKKKNNLERKDLL